MFIYTPDGPTTKQMTTTTQPTTTPMATTTQPTTTPMATTTPPRQLEHVCKNHFKHLDCTPENVVICSAFYGRNDSTICPSDDANTSNMCFEDVTDLVQGRWCRNKPSCYVHGRGYLLDHPCLSNPEAYLQVTYTCGAGQCADTIPSVVTQCPSNFNTTVPVGQTITFVSWNIPSGIDDSGTKYQVVPSRGPGVFFLGIHDITYTFTDPSENEWYCTFRVIVVQR
ncbi:uncharacterized protein LOC105437547 [Strongylocentrotus purpuratus]|uniref:HYR domain-containing protein n=1 Tax=Strongylocentrotus purpuratus TaxID=7668 RepID=A0A7M7NFV3_STRPU|nr:uncharacterized protein LOC105437547 [Strongylocentrotus purpuratus]